VIDVQKPGEAVSRIDDARRRFEEGGRCRTPAGDLRELVPKRRSSQSEGVARLDSANSTSGGHVMRPRGDRVPLNGKRGVEDKPGSRRRRKPSSGCKHCLGVRYRP